MNVTINEAGEHGRVGKLDPLAPGGRVDGLGRPDSSDCVALNDDNLVI